MIMIASTGSKYNSLERNKNDDELREEEKMLLDRKPYNNGRENNLKNKKKFSKVGLSNDDNRKSKQEYFGVRSYLHNFYESVTVKNPQLYEDIYEDDLAYMGRAKKRRLRIFRWCWRFSLMFGILLLLIGLTFLLFGYLTPHREVIAGFREDMEIVDRRAQKFNAFLNLCRVVGLAVFCGGGGIFCMALLLPVMINLQCEEDVNREPFQVMFAPEEPPRSPTDKKIPATEELASIQPKREAVEEVVMTNSGLCKVPVPTRVINP